MLYSNISRVFCLAAVVSLVACGEQPVKPEEMASATEVSEEKSTVELKKVEPELTKPSIEPSVVEVMPRKQSDASKIAVESIPAKDEAPAVAETVDQESQSVEPVPSKVGSIQQEIAPTESRQDAQLLDAAPPIEAASLIPASTGPNEFVVTVSAKQPSHPAFGKGHSMGFIVNGVSGKELVVERGKTYTFNIATNPKHDVYLSKKAIGWGSAPYSEGVEGDFTYKGTITFKPGKDTPDQLFYACRNHPYMGAMIHVIDPGQKIEIRQQTATAVDVNAAKAQSVVTESKVKQKLLFADMMAGAQGAKRVMASQNDEAKQLVTEAKKLVTEARNKSLAGALPEALILANQALKKLSEATSLVPDDEELAQLAENYKTGLAEISGYQTSYRANLKRLEKQGAVAEGIKFDEKKFAELLAKAQSLAEQKNFVRANKLLQQAQATVTAALHKMLDSTTLVYDLKFETPADEYGYELKRFASYEELIPIAIEAKKPAPGAVKLMESFLDKARKRRDEAQSKADAGDYPSAIGMMLQATKTVRRALRMIGVTQ
jgi:HEPN domain-containing protein